MRKDKWISVSEARKLLLSTGNPQIIDTDIRSNSNGRFLCGINKYNVSLREVRIFYGDEHTLAQKDKVLDWSHKETSLSDANSMIEKAYNKFELVGPHAKI